MSIKEAPAAAALRAETQESVKPKRRKAVVIAVSVAAVALVVGGIFGVNAANAYRADIEQMQAQIAEDRAEAERLNADTIALAAEAQESADAAQEAADSLAAQEAAEIAAAAAQAAEWAAQGLTESGKCPAGTVAGEVNADGTEGLCAPTGPQGQACAEYTDNVCTAWLKP